MSHHMHTVDHVPQGAYKVSQGLKLIFGLCALIGIITFIAALFLSPHRAWPNFLINYFYFLCLGLFGAFFVALQHITNAYWSVTVRRLAEGLMAYLPVALLLAVVLVLGRHHIYEWANAEVIAKDHVLQSKAGYLNSSFFLIRHVLFLSLWILLGYQMIRNSLKQDSSGEHALTLSNVKLSAIFLPIFGISFTLISFDLVMSLEPTWYSTIFGLYCFSGLFVSGLSLLAVMMIYGRKQGVFPSSIVNENHLHDVGKLMFAFTVFWGYIMFSQLMLIWYANLPEEIQYYLRRFHGGWWGVSVFLFLLHFVIPFFLLLPREAKRKEKYLLINAFIILASQWVDCYFMIMPVFFEQGPVFSWIEVGTFLGFLGIFGIAVSRFLDRVPAIPVKDPRLVQCLAHSQ